MKNSCARGWSAGTRRVQPVIPERVETVYVLSRVTLGADIKITSMILDAMKKRFPGARIVFVANSEIGRAVLVAIRASLRISTPSTRARDR